MSPEVTTAMALVTIVDKLGGWSVGGVLVFVGITPALFVYLAARIIGKSLADVKAQLVISEKESAARFAVFRNDYDNNIMFVKTYEKLTARMEDTQRRSTIALTKMIDRIDTMRRGK